MSERRGRRGRRKGKEEEKKRKKEGHIKYNAHLIVPRRDFFDPILPHGNVFLDFVQP